MDTLNAFNFDFSDESVKGEPRRIRVERRDLREDGNFRVQCIDEFRSGGTRSERTVFRDDGSVSWHSLFDENGEPIRTNENKAKNPEIPPDLPFRIETKDSAGVQETTFYSQAGEQIAELQARIQENCREGSFFLPGLDQPVLTKIETIEERDAHCNWIRKRIAVYQMSSPEPQQIEEFRRDIEYY